MTGRLFGRFDADFLDNCFDDAGIYRCLAGKGFTRPGVALEVPDTGLTHVRLWATKSGDRHALLEACLTESRIPEEFFRQQGHGFGRAAELLSVYWVREQDPTSGFTPARPALPLQEHPGLGILRQAFQVAVRLAREMGKDGIACAPKFFHDAVIFYRSHLFLFLDPAQQGRFEALARDLRPLPLGRASLLLVSGDVHDETGRVAFWEVLPQVCPLSPDLCGFFNSPSYAQSVTDHAAAHRFDFARGEELAFTPDAAPSA